MFKFGFHGKIVYENKFLYQYYGKDNSNFFRKFLYHGYSLTSNVSTFTFEGTNPNATGNWALFRVNLSGLPTTAEITNARLILTVGQTSGTYSHQLWTLNSTGRAWSDTEATWNYANNSIEWTDSLGSAYKGGYADRQNLVSIGTVWQDEERVSFALNSTGKSYVQSNAGGNVEFILLSDYSTPNYAQYRSVEDPDVNKRPEFVVDYVISLPSMERTNKFIFYGKDTFAQAKKFCLHGFDTTSYDKKFIYHGKQDFDISKQFIFYGYDNYNSYFKYQFYGKQEFSSGFKFLFDSIGDNTFIGKFVFFGVNLSSIFGKFIFTGSMDSVFMKNFCYQGKVDVNAINRFQFHGVTSTFNSFRFCYDSGFQFNDSFPFIFFGEQKQKFGYTVGDHKKSNIKDRKEDYVSNLDYHNYRDFVSEPVNPSQRKNIVIK
jgi:hypothetical protein